MTGPGSRPNGRRTAALHRRADVHRSVIDVTSGIGSGPTKLSAFDAALREAGIANFNLIHLSSVIPPGSEIVKSPVQRHPFIRAHVEQPSEDHGEHRQLGAWGDRLYVVLADRRVERPHEEAWAGVGWVQEEATGRGLFVEHAGHSESQVQADIESSLEGLIRGRPDVRFGPGDLLIRGTVCIDEPVCALVAAAFESEPWRGEPIIDLR